MVNEKAIICVKCGKKYPPFKNIFHCSECGGSLDIVYDYKKVRDSINKDFIKQPPNHWKYWMFYPVSPKKIISMGEGGTPLVKSKVFENVWFKLEGLNPTGSFKDRGSTVEVSHAYQLGVKNVCCASTGNMGASVAAYCARAGMRCKIFLSGSTSKNKVKQIKSYGAEVHQVDGNYNQALKMCEEFAMEKRWHLMGDYPYRGEGEKSVGFEIADQMGWESPSYILVPMGNGTLTYAIWDSFQEMESLELVHKIPRIVGFQSTGCSPIVNAFKKGWDDVKPIENPYTVATAIECGNPIDGKKALIALKKSGGFAESVTDEEILKAQLFLAREEGILVEPSSAATVAGYMKLKDSFEGKVVCVLTGHGLKDL